MKLQTKAILKQVSKPFRSSPSSSQRRNVEESGGSLDCFSKEKKRVGQSKRNYQDTQLEQVS